MLVEKEVDKLRIENETFKEKIQSLENQIEKQENQSRRNNTGFRRVPEQKERETWKDHKTKICKIVGEKMESDVEEKDRESTPNRKQELTKGNNSYVQELR